MPDIQITVKDKIAQAHGSPQIVCGNSDYTVHFTFDAEWDAYEYKTLGMKFCRHGRRLTYEVTFTGNTCDLPPVYGVDEVEIGVYAGDIRTSTGARVCCIGCIMDGDPVHADPPQDVYNQLMELLKGGSDSGINPMGTHIAVMPQTALGVAGYAEPVEEEE